VKDREWLGSSTFNCRSVSEIEVSCFAYEGIDAIKAALHEGLKCSTEEMPIKVTYWH